MSTSTRAVTSPVGRSLGSRRLKGALPSVTSLAPDHFTEPESPQGDASLNPLRAPRTCEKPVLRARRQKEGTATVQRVFLSVSPTRSAIASLFLTGNEVEVWFEDAHKASGNNMDSQRNLPKRYRQQRKAEKQEIQSGRNSRKMNIDSAWI